MPKLSERKFKEQKKEEFSNKKRKKKLLRNDKIPPKKDFKQEYFEEWDDYVTEEETDWSDLDSE